MINPSLLRPAPVAFLLVAFFAHGSSRAQADSVVVKEYLGSHKEQVADTGHIAMLDTLMRDRSFFLFGESHGSAEPHALDLRMFKQLYAFNGVRSYVAEVDETKAWMLNTYLADGNEQWLRKVFSDWVADTAQWASQENFDKWKGLRSFYAGLPAGDKFRVYGVDALQNVHLLKEHLAALIAMGGAKRVTASMDSLLRIVDTLSDAGRRGLGEFSRRMLEQMTTNIRIAGTTGKNHQAFLRLLTSLSYIQPGVSRDSVMYLNMLHIARENALTEQPIYSFIGSYHALMTGFNGRSPFASLLEHGEESPFQGSLVSALMVTLDGKMALPLVSEVRRMMPSFVIGSTRKANPDYHSDMFLPYDAGNDGSVMKREGAALLRSVSRPKAITFFRLNDHDSPFDASKLLSNVSGFQQISLTDASSVTTDAFQAVILFRNSHAAHELTKDTAR